MKTSSRLLSWFCRNRRNLPWRSNRSPYSVWISEIMLQQTVVQTVIPYFEKWMKKFPDVQTLAASTEGEILRQWEGLGYYNRARNILKTARMIVKEFGGNLPNNERDLLRLPGIGKYTASAILSIAFGKPVPLIDANVRKVGRRFLGLEKWDKQNEKKLTDWLSGILPPRHAGDFNEALMELGQTICLLENPLCEKCPLKKDCVAFAHNLQENIPGITTRRIIEKKSVILLLIHEQKILIRKKTDGLWKGMWVLPDFPSRKKAEEFVIEITGATGCFVKKLPERTHHYTRYRDRLTPLVYLVASSLRLKHKGWRWASINRIDCYPCPSKHRIILTDLLKIMKTVLYDSSARYA